MGVAWDTLSCRAALTWSTRQSARWGEDGCRLGILDAARGIGWLLVGLVRIVTEWGSEVVDRVLGRARLVAQRLVGPGFPRPVEAVAAFGAHQGQDLPGVLSSLALRTTNRSMARVLDAFAAGEIVRGYPMRGTVFAVAAADLRWMTELCAGRKPCQPERIWAAQGIDVWHQERSADIAVELLTPGPASRADLAARWREAGLVTSPGTIYHLLTGHISAGLLCYGPVRDGDHQLVLCDGWLPAGSGIEGRFNGDREAAAAELLRRYLASRGPATLRDFAWWSKLPLSLVRRVFPLIRADFEENPGDEPGYQRAGLADEIRQVGRQASRPLLLPGFDEFILGYQDRLFALTAADHPRLVPGNNGAFRRSAIAGGQVVGLWKRAGSPGRRRFELDEFGPLSERTRTSLARRFSEFPFFAD